MSTPTTTTDNGRLRGATFRNTFEGAPSKINGGPRESGITERLGAATAEESTLRGHGENQSIAAPNTAPRPLSPLLTNRSTSLASELNCSPLYFPLMNSFFKIFSSFMRDKKGVRFR